MVVALSQVLGGAGLAAGITVGALLAQDLLGSDGLAGIPTALFTLGSALAAYSIGRITQRHGRRTGLVIGFGAAAAGAAGVVLATLAGATAAVLVSLFVYGAGTATNLQARYAGTDLALPAQRGTAVSIAMVSTTLGAVAGPNLVQPLGDVAVGLGLPALTGPFLMAGLAYLAAGSVLLVLLRPDPYLMARELDQEPADTARRQREDDTARSVPQARGGAYLGATVMVLAQVSMVAIMTMTPVHMRAHHHDLGAVGLVISLHVAAMWLPSPITGLAVDRIGRIPVAVAGGAILLAAGGLAALAPGDSTALLVAALVLLGLGWNMALMAGTAMVVDATAPATRARAQGSVDVLVALSGAGGGLMSGVVMSAMGFTALAWAGGLLSLVLIPLLFFARRDSRRPRHDSRAPSRGSRAPEH